MIIGIDVGSKGGASFLMHDGSVSAYPFEGMTRLDLVTLLEQKVEEERKLQGVKHSPVIRAIIEDVNARPNGKVKIGATSAFTFGKMAERPAAMLSALRIPYSLMRPQEWQKALRLTKPKDYSKGKVYLYEKAQELYPKVFDGQLKGWGKAVCDAVLIMEVARIQRVDKSIGL